MAPMQPSLGPPRDEPRVFGLDKFNGDNFAEWSFNMENIFDHYDLLEVMEGTEKRPENDPEKSPWVRKSAQGYLLVGQALGSSQICHVKPFQREPEKGPKAWAALKGVHAPATSAVAVVLERRMAALRIEEDEAVEEGVQKFFVLLTRLEGADLNYSELQKKTKFLALLPESCSSLIINLNRDLPRLSLEDVKRAILQEDFRRREAMSGPWASQWRAAMDSEMASYRSAGTYFDEVPPLGANVVDGMWIFRVKRPPGCPSVFKARYVAKGFSQCEGVDFFQTFAPTPNMTTLRHDTFRSTQSDLGFHPSSADPSLFVRRGSTLFFVLVYIDNLVFATGDTIALADVKLELQKRHTCTDLGEMRHYLGLQITRDRAARTITLSQSHMVQQVLQQFELQHSTIQRTPLAVDHRLTGPFPDEPFEPSGPYAELVGCLMVGKYLAMTSGMGLVLGGRLDVVLTVHCDSSYADDPETHRSTQGYCFSLGSGAVSCRSTHSSSVSTSTAEAEIYARAMAAQELRWLTFLLTFFCESCRGVDRLVSTLLSPWPTLQTSSPRPCRLVSTRGVVCS
ncbi:unnamed protein product [Closterium sp. NIES-53]